MTELVTPSSVAIAGEGVGLSEYRHRSQWVELGAFREHACYNVRGQKQMEATGRPPVEKGVHGDQFTYCEKGACP